MLTNSNWGMLSNVNGKQNSLITIALLYLRRKEKAIGAQLRLVPTWVIF